MSIAPIHPQNFPFIYFGHPLILSEEKSKFVPIWKQQATDEKGRKRFHGAFTGGFTAGYHNTVGSKEGWLPSEYKKKSYSGNREDRLLSIMDEEDVDDYSQAAHSRALLPKSCRKLTLNLKIIPIRSDQQARKQNFDSSCPSLQIIAQARELMAEGQLGQSVSSKPRSNEVIDDDEQSYEDDHCYGSPEHRIDEKKLSIKAKLSIAPFELRVYEALSSTDIMASEKNEIPIDLLVTPQTIPESFFLTPRSDKIDHSAATGSILTPMEANAALSSSYEPFESAPEKQKRYKLFLHSIAKGNNLLLEKDEFHEMKEFYRAALIFRPLSHEMSQRFISSTGKEEPQNRKEASSIDAIIGERAIPWIPSLILCKRLGIDPPSKKEHMPQKFVKEILDRDTMRLMLKSLSSSSTPVLDMESEDFVYDSITAFELRPEPSFFKELFDTPASYNLNSDLCIRNETLNDQPVGSVEPKPSAAKIISNVPKKNIATKQQGRTLSFD